MTINQMVLTNQFRGEKFLVFRRKAPKQYSSFNDRDENHNYAKWSKDI